MNSTTPAPVTFEGTHSSLEIIRPSAGVILLVFRGLDTGEFGDAPFAELARDLSHRLPVEIFVDARSLPAVSVDVSAEWAQWMMANRERIQRLNMLCGSRFIELTASFVRRFTEFGPRMRIYTDAAAFEEALRAASGLSAAPGSAS